MRFLLVIRFFCRGFSSCSVDRVEFFEGTFWPDAESMNNRSIVNQNKVFKQTIDTWMILPKFWYKNIHPMLYSFNIVRKQIINYRPRWPPGHNLRRLSRSTDKSSTPGKLRKACLIPLSSLKMTKGPRRIVYRLFLILPYNKKYYI